MAAAVRSCCKHTGTMTRGAPQLTVSVVPDSGPGGLAGLAGTMTISVADGRHSGNRFSCETQ